MARKIVHQLIDDVDGAVLEACTGSTVHFALEGVAYEIDLSESNAAQLRAALAPYVRAARRLPRGAGVSVPASRAQRRQDLAAVRAWARERGHEISDRGRVPVDVLEAYDAAH